MNFCTKLRNEVTRLIDSLIECFPQEKRFMEVSVYINTSITEHQLMQIIIDSVLPYKEQIIRKDESFFKNNRRLFGKHAPNVKEKTIGDLVSHFSAIWDGHGLSKKSKNTIWDYFLVFIRLAELYKKENK